MKIHEQRCPYCGANLVLEPGLSSFFCKYCGGAIHVDDSDKHNIELRKMEHAETMKKLDNAHDFRTMDHIERIQSEAHLQERYMTKQKNRGGFRIGCVTIVAIIVVGFVVLCGIAAYNDNHGAISRQREKDEDAKKIAIHEREVARLTAIEQEVLAEIAEGDFSTALVKANTIHYNAPTFYGIGVYGAADKWDNRREEIIKSIYLVSGINTPSPSPDASLTN